jgi:diketogulonate reductase-like aldo/keto reductase
MVQVPQLRVHGADIPQIGFGTSGLGEQAGEIVAAALKAGYRHIDTAWKYGTERGVGEGIRGARRSLSPPKCRMNICALPTSNARPRRA